MEEFRSPKAPGDRIQPPNESESTMNANTATPSATNRGFRREVAFLVALLLASLAFGVGLPWIISDAPPDSETLWAREIQSRAPTTPSLSAPTAPKRSASRAFH